MLEKAAPVPSTTPLRAVKSSAWFWLKLPHRPSDQSQEVSRLFNLATLPRVVAPLSTIKGGLGRKTLPSASFYNCPQMSP